MAVDDGCGSGDEYSVEVEGDREDVVVVQSHRRPATTTSWTAMTTAWKTMVWMAEEIGAIVGAVVVRGEVGRRGDVEREKRCGEVGEKYGGVECMVGVSIRFSVRLFS